MKTTYKLRFANKNDISDIEDIFREIVAEKKRLSQSDMVMPGFLKDLVARTVSVEEMLVVENGSDNIEMIGEIHNYQDHYHNDNGNSVDITEMAFFTNLISKNKTVPTDLIDWLHKEISSKHSEVFRVELTTQLNCQKTLDRLNRKGIKVNSGQGAGVRLKGVNVMLPLAWDNPSFK